MNNCEKNFGFIHKAGILMPISSLPSPYGIGTFGKGAFDFIDLLDECKQTCWQVLPLNPTSYGDSPYQSPASVAGNPYFIDPDLLKAQKLLTAEELADLKTTQVNIDYGRLFNTRYPMLRTAYSRLHRILRGQRGVATGLRPVYGPEGTLRLSSMDAVGSGAPRLPQRTHPRR